MVPEYRDVDVKSEALETSDIQGIIVSGYKHLRCSSYHFLRFDNGPAARQWLKALWARITSSDWRQDGKIVKPEAALNIAFTASGLNALGVPTLDTFPQEFCEGMYETHRARRLGDFGQSAPENWEFGGAGNRIHALLILQAPTRAALDALDQAEKATWEQHHIAAEVTEIGETPENFREHFGFHDSISQPLIDGAPGNEKRAGDVIRAGEFVLGYRNEYGVLAPIPKLFSPGDVKAAAGGSPERGRAEFGRNGSFLVFRKLHQDVATFNRFIARYANNDPDEQAWLGAKMVGRWPSGTPLVLSPNADSPYLTTNNDFRYLPTDGDGFACPLGAHIRRTNPRDSLAPDPVQSVRTVLRHRLLRRGVSYGERLPDGITKDDGKPRGLLFICINADIQRQFEFVQQTWVNDPKFNGLFNERDPLIGSHPDVGEPKDDDGMLTIQGEPVRRRLNGLQRFVTLKGGGYFFLPSMSALKILSELS